MDNSFIIKEREYIKQNKELEQKRKELLEKVEDAMKTQHFLLNQQNESSKEKSFHLHLPQNNIECKDLQLPQCIDEMGSKGMLQFYKAKIKAIQCDLGKLQTELKQKSEELSKMNRNYQSTNEEKEKWFLQYNIEKNNNAKLEKQLSTVNNKLQLKENENMGLKKEVERLKNEVKNTTNELNISENRLQRALQEVDKTKTLLKTVRQDEKEIKEAYKNNVKDLTATVKQIQKHKTELLNGYKKQIQLIDILKKQKAHVENSKVLEIVETDFMKLLDWKLD